MRQNIDEYRKEYFHTTSTHYGSSDITFLLPCVTCPFDMFVTECNSSP